MAIIPIHFGQPDPGPIPFTLGDTLLIQGTPAATLAEAYVYKFSANFQAFAEFYVSGISTETGGAPDKNYVLSDCILQVAPNQTQILVEVEQRYRYIYLPPENDRVLQTRTLLVTVTDTEIQGISLIESDETTHISDHFSAFVQGRSRACARIAAKAPQGSSIQRVDIYDGPDDTGTRLGSMSFDPMPGRLINQRVDEYAPLKSSGEHQRTVVITDARGRKVASTLPITVQPYQPPSVPELSMKRADASGTPMAGGTCALMIARLNASSIVVDGAERNSLNMVVRHRRAFSDEPWDELSLPLTASGDEQRVLIPAVIPFDTEQSYQFELLLSDYFSTVTRTALLSKVSSLLSLHTGGRGIGIGKRATETELLDVALGARFQEPVRVEKEMHVQGLLSLGTALRPEHGGTGVTSLDELKSLLGEGGSGKIQRGSYTFSIDAGVSMMNYTIYYPAPFSAVPAIQLTLQLISGFENMFYALSFVGASYFQMVVSNANATSKSCVMHWIAVV